MRDRAVVAATTTHTPIQRTLRTTRPVPTIFPTMITVSRITEHRLIIIVPPPTSGARTFATIHGMTNAGIRARTGMDITRIGAGGTVIGRTTAADIADIIVEVAEGISLLAEQER